MSITNETAKAHANDPAVCCCRFEAGTVVEAANLEDPAIFPDLIDSGLLELPENYLTIGQVLGAKLKETLDALTPMTTDNVEGYVDPSAEEAAEEEAAEESVASFVAPQAQSANVGGVIKINIGEGKGISLEIPTGLGGGTVANAVAASVPAATVGAPVEEEKTTVIRSLTKKHYKIDKVVFGDKTEINGTTLTIRNPEAICAEAVATEELVYDLSLDIITPDRYNEYSEAILDLQPIATKESGELGEGVTRVLDGVVMVLTGTDANGVQIGEFGSSEGAMDTTMMWGRPGAADFGEIFIKGQVTIKEGTNMERPGPLAAHKAFDYITQEIREALKAVEDESLVVNTEVIDQVRRTGRKKIVIVKEIMGQGAMHDNLILPVEPVGTLGARPNVDLGNVPVVLSPLEVLDGGIHALTCIGPASKEMSRHYWREPLVTLAMNDEEFDLVGVVFVGSPQANSEKFYVSRRLGMLVESMEVDGAVVTTEGFGNNHIDFASHIEQIGMRGIPVVGVSYCAVQGALVVGNKYMTHMVDNNKSRQGIENEILENNTLAPEEAYRIISMLKNAIEGVEVKAAERKWNNNVKLNNIDAIEKTLGIKIPLEENETSLNMTRKRSQLYERADIEAGLVEDTYTPVEGEK
ncbi:D-proline reductase (dithiol) proprotein PrdA [Peptostreptococcus porci]|uniref:D-proline reductase (dithiol) proprotein PrdA n=1 Tax=Peptostreptococcus porci TaxID=2652282 RepID=UPI0023F43748|nr:D-proline reductase (dithiol) proprotein PrdA [Peptostreptococcus porci]MDD7183407.1 D-proline reductase (dithiol) proprotein PrdA [Peptostreptococcus porci]MDY2794424.1 D-proline reductase (dithiol) proprotein PrdA [Peptostreptococcus porci]MDY4128963.1 D-proline reductase (dithiol) proprotein PrdA [Peptostreptococcus porci]MDY5435902.1 D-proline reductase (dithiol) proprotein PrdA [Peptostreptococcus porci]MDY6232167.1 D-proline reductase (dithiol) proprotein PrdA [Peptostreptococcus porc